MRQIDAVLKTLRILRNNKTLINGAVISNIVPTNQAEPPRVFITGVWCSFQTFRLQFIQKDVEPLTVKVDLSNSDNRSPGFKAWCNNQITDLQVLCSDNGGNMPEWIIGDPIR